MSRPSTARTIIESWITKGDIEQDPFSKFIYYWVAFNCWYMSVREAGSDREVINSIKKYEKLKQAFLSLVNSRKGSFYP